MSYRHRPRIYVRSTVNLNNGSVHYHDLITTLSYDRKSWLEELNKWNRQGSEASYVGRINRIFYSYYSTDLGD